MVLQLAERPKKERIFAQKKKHWKPRKTVIARITSNIFLMK